MTAWLSAFHALGFMLVMSGAVVWNLRAAGAVLGGVPLESIARPALRVWASGLTLSVVTGAALFAPRAIGTAASGAFQLKMSLLAAAVAYELIGGLRADARPRAARRFPRARGIAGVALWLALAGSACWFILFE